MQTEIQEKIERLKKLLTKEQKVKNNFQKIVALMPIPVFVVEDNTDTIVYLNEAFSALVGYSPDDLLDSPCDILVPEEYKEIRKKLRAEKTQEELDSLQYTCRNHPVSILHKSGKILNLPTLFYNWRNNGDRFSTMLIIDRRVSDISFSTLL